LLYRLPEKKIRSPSGQAINLSIITGFFKNNRANRGWISSLVASAPRKQKNQYKPVQSNPHGKHHQEASKSASV